MFDETLGFELGEDTVDGGEGYVEFTFTGLSFTGRPLYGNN